jgi:hypothetical protein
MDMYGASGMDGVPASSIQSTHSIPLSQPRLSGQLNPHQSIKSNLNNRGFPIKTKDILDDRIRAKISVVVRFCFGGVCIDVWGVLKAP